MLQGSESQLIHIFIFSENTFYQNMFFYPDFLAGCFITGQYGGKLCHEISPWCGMVLVLVLELELVLDLVSENLC